MPKLVRAVLGASFLVGSPAAAYTAPQTPPKVWAEVKCERYSKAWKAALSHYGSAGLGPEFLARHAAFLASDCRTKANVCARSPEEIRLANVMVVLAMNAGTASTFPPFYCRN